jgi:hypothetical protein
MWKLMTPVCPYCTNTRPRIATSISRLLAWVKMKNLMAA